MPRDLRARAVCGPWNASSLPGSAGWASTARAFAGPVAHEVPPHGFSDLTTLKALQRRRLRRWQCAAESIFQDPRSSTQDRFESPGRGRSFSRERSTALMETTVLFSSNIERSSCARTPRM